MEKEIQLWCKKNGWTDLYYVKEEDLFYATPPGETKSLPLIINQKSDKIFKITWLYKEFTIYGFINYWVCFLLRFIFEIDAYGVWVSSVAFWLLSIVLFIEWKKSISKELPTPQLKAFVFGSFVAFVLQFLFIRPV